MPAVFRDWDKEMSMEKEGWCGRFVASSAVVDREGGKAAASGLLQSWRCNRRTGC